MVTVKYQSNFWRLLEMPLINYEINLQLKWSKNILTFSRLFVLEFEEAHG